MLGDPEGLTVRIEVAAGAHDHGRSGEAVQRILKRAHEVIGKHERFTETSLEAADLMVTVHHREASAIRRDRVQQGSTGMWRVGYDSVVPGSAAKQFGEWFEQVLDEASVVP